MSGGVLFGVAILMGEFCVVWSDWANLLCWVSINCEWWLMFKKVTKFLQGGAKLIFLLLWLVLELRFLSFSQRRKMGHIEKKMPEGVGYINFGG